MDNKKSLLFLFDPVVQTRPVSGFQLVEKTVKAVCSLLVDWIHSKLQLHVSSVTMNSFFLCIYKNMCM